MKFYKDYFCRQFWRNIFNDKLTCVYFDDEYKGIIFYKNGKEHNTKNAAYFKNTIKEFRLNDKFYGNHRDFNKKSWRSFLKLQVFL